MAIFNIKLLNYQRVYYMVNCSPFTVPGVFSPKRLRYTFWAALLLFFLGQASLEPTCEVGYPLVIFYIAIENGPGNT